jgi:hypothetical protein
MVRFFSVVFIVSSAKESQQVYTECHISVLFGLRFFYTSDFKAQFHIKLALFENRNIFFSLVNLQA